MDHLAGLVAQQQATLLALDVHFLERHRTEQGLSDEPARSPVAEAVNRGSSAFVEQLTVGEVTKDGTYAAGQVDNHVTRCREEGRETEKREDLMVGQSWHEDDMSERGGGKAEVKRRVLQRGASLDVWAEPRDVSEDGNGGACCEDYESGADSSFEFDTSPLAVLSASSPDSEAGSPGFRQKRREWRNEVEVIVEEVVDAVAEAGVCDVFVSQTVPESPLTSRVGKEVAGSCDSPLESERDLSSPGEGLGAGRESEPERSIEVGSSVQEELGGYGVGGVEGVFLQLGERDGFDQQGIVMEGGDGGAFEEQGEVGTPGIKEWLSNSEAEGTENTARAVVLEDHDGQQTASGGLDAKGQDTVSGDGEMEEFLGLAMDVQHVETGFAEESAPTELPEVESLKNLGQDAARQVTVEGAGTSFQLGYAELSRASSYDEKTLRSSWPVTAVGTPQDCGRWVEGEGPESVPRNGRIPEQNGRAFTFDGRSGSAAWAMVPLEIAQEVVVEGFGDEDFDGWRHGSVSESGTASQTSADAFSLDPPLMETSGGESKTDGLAERFSPRARQGAWGGSPKLVPYSPQGPRANPPSPRVMSPKTVVPMPPPNPRGPSPSSPHFASAQETSRKVVGNAATGRRVGSPSDFGAAAQRLETRAGKLFRRDSLPRRNNTSDPFGLQEAALVPHPPSAAAPARKPSTREKQLAATLCGRKSSDKENDLPRVPTVTLRLEGLALIRKPGNELENGRKAGLDSMRKSGLESGTEWGLSASDVHSEDVAAPEPPARPRTTSSRPQFRALRPMAS